MNIWVIISKINIRTLVIRQHDHNVKYRCPEIGQGPVPFPDSHAQLFYGLLLTGCDRRVADAE